MKPIILMAGLPGTGKTYSARLLEKRLGYIYHNPYVTKHELGFHPYKRMDDLKPLIDFFEKLEQRVLEGEGLVIDKHSPSSSVREYYYGRARDLGCQVLLMLHLASEETAKRRLMEKPNRDGIGYPLEDTSIYERILARWEDPLHDLTKPENQHVSMITYNTETNVVSETRIKKEMYPFAQVIKSVLFSSSIIPIH